MTTILLCLTAYGLLMFAAGMRLVTALGHRRRDRRGGYIDLTLTGTTDTLAQAIQNAEPRKARLTL